MKPISSIRWNHGLGWAVAGVLAVVVAGGAASAAVGGGTPATPGSSTSKLTDAQKADRKAGSALKRFGNKVEHAEAVLRTKDGTRSVLVQRGEVTAVSADEMTVKSPDGFQATWDLTDATKVRSDGKKGDASDLATGDKVGVAGTGAGSSGKAGIVREKG